MISYVDEMKGYEKGLYGARKMALLHARNLRGMAKRAKQIKDRESKAISQWLWQKSEGARDVAEMCRDVGGRRALKTQRSVTH